MKKITAMAAALSLIASLFISPIARADSAPAQMEYLGRGTVAVKTKDGVYLSWRLLGTENYDTAFDVYRDGRKIDTVSDSTNYTDAQIGASYMVVPSGEHVSSGKAVTVWDNQYITIPLDRPGGGTSLDGDTYTYSPNDVEPADVDGDGEYELILKWEPSNSFDSGKDAHHNGNVYIDCYELDGTKLWRIDMGININAGNHFTQIAAYDFDLDGKAELAMKTAPGTKDGKGKFVSEASLIDEIKAADNTADYRHSEGRENDTGGRVLSGPEYYTVFQGDTGEALDTVYYPHPRGTVKEWGDDWGNRSERYLTAVAYLDGQRPSVIAWRGYYAKTTATAYNLVNKKLVQIADFDTSADGNGRYAGNGNHNLTVGDVDDDGCDEIICGALCLDDDLTPLWCSGRGHGDALHLADYDPTHEGMEYFSVHEDYSGKAITGSTTGHNGEPHLGGMTLYDAATGEELFHEDGYGDTGRGMMANVGYGNGYFELWGAGNFVSHGGTDVQKGKYNPDSTNFRIFWDGDLYDELLDGTGGEGSQIKITGGGKKGRVQSLRNVQTINGTKNNPCLQADLFGDWREEIVAKGSDSSLLVYTTTAPTEHKLYTLMHDRAYRMQTASQNSAYNQPPHISYYVSDSNDKYDARRTAAYISTVHDGKTAVRTTDIPKSATKFSIKAIGNRLTITNKRKQKSDAVLYTAKYNNGALADVTVQKITIPENGYSAEISAEVGDTVYLWDKSHQPLAKSAVVEAAPTAAPTATPKVTPTPRATATPNPTDTPAPTATATPVPTPTPDFEVDEDGVLTAYNGNAAEVVIPESVDGIKITAIGDDVFISNSLLTSAVIPEGVTIIGQRAFRGCDNLTAVSLPSTLETIACEAFEECTSLENINFPPNLKAIEQLAFYYCEELTDITLPASVKTIGEAAFACCYGLNNINLENVEVIEFGAFESCTALEEIVLGENISRIDLYAFEYCNMLKKATVKSRTVDLSESYLTSANEIHGYAGSKAEYYALYNNIPFYDLETGEEIKKEFLVDENGVLEKYIQQKSGAIKIPSEVDGITVTSIGEKAFQGSGVVSVIIPNTVMTIERFAFYRTGNLIKMVIPESVTDINDRAFHDYDDEQFKLYVKAGSYAEEYAKTNNIPYVIEE